MSGVLIKAYVRLPFGTHDVYMLQLDPESEGIEDLRQEISSLVGERPVELSWIDQDGDHIRLSTDKQLKFAVTYGLKENVLRISVRVSWSGQNPMAQSAHRQEVLEQPAEDVVDMEESGDDASDVEDDDEEDTAGDGPVARAFAKSEAPTKPRAKKAKKAVAKRESTCSSARCDNTGSTHCSGYVRTIGPDGITKERNLSPEEAAQVLSHSMGTLGIHRLPASLPFSMGSSLFGHPQLAHRQPTQSPFYLTW